MQVETTGDSPRSATDSEELRRRYVTLLKHALTHTLYWPLDRAPAPEQVVDGFKEAFEEAIARGEFRWDAREERAEGRDWPRYAQTMVGLRRLDNVEECVNRVLAEQVPGDLIEAGIWRGGVAIFMRGLLAAHGIRDRTVFAADSFEGLPEPNQRDYPADEGNELHAIDALAISRDEVEANFDRYGLLDDQVTFLEGWFRDTLPLVRERRWSVVRVDGDLYESTMDALVSLYPGLSVGGFLIVDDFAHAACRQAVDDYRAANGIEDPIRRVDWTGAYWRRSA